MTKHPAKYTDNLIPVLANFVQNCTNIIDPFAGTGKAFEIYNHGYTGRLTCIELEPEWASAHPEVIVGNALYLNFPDNTFDGGITSPCLAHGHKILRRDLRWIPVEDIRVGDEIIAFDEYPTTKKSDGQLARRRWRHGVVVRSETKRVNCMRVNLSNGESVVCTPEHPWLAQRYASGGNGKLTNMQGGHTQWVQAKDLMTPNTCRRRVHGRWMDIPRKSTGWWVNKQLDVWQEDKSYEAGWLAGIFDGEGSLSFGNHGCPKLQASQVVGPIADLIEERLQYCGFEYNVIPRKIAASNRQDMISIYINGGFPEILRFLGSLRPTRLMNKLDSLDVQSRTVQAREKAQVISVEDVGMRDIQEIQTSTGTYIGDGYLMHNCYANRMADHHEAKDSSRRNTYRHAIGRPLHSDNSGQLQWGDDYRNFHLRAWTELKRVLQNNSIFALNIKNHIRKNQEQRVTEWHIECLSSLGFSPVEHVKVNCPGNRFGKNYQLRIEYESVIKFILSK